MPSATKFYGVAVPGPAVYKTWNECKAVCVIFRLLVEMILHELPTNHDDMAFLRAMKEVPLSTLDRQLIQAKPLHEDFVNDTPWVWVFIVENNAAPEMWKCLSILAALQLEKLKIVPKQKGDSTNMRWLMSWLESQIEKPSSRTL